MSDEALDRLAATVSDYALQEVYGRFDEAVGDSPIEKLFITALQSYVAVGASEFRYVELCRTKEQLDRGMSSKASPLALFVEPQAQLDGWRVDFLVHAWSHGRVTLPGWQRLIVECDGHDFHERTRKQAARDRSRDRFWQSRGVQVFRFTGSEIWKDSWSCAAQVSAWAVRGWL